MVMRSSELTHRGKARKLNFRNWSVSRAFIEHYRHDRSKECTLGEADERATTEQFLDEEYPFCNQSGGRTRKAPSPEDPILALSIR